MKVSNHAIERFRERTGCKKSDISIQNKLLKFADLGKPAEFRTKGYATLALINHNFERAEYLMYNDWILVIADDCIITIHENESKRWTIK
mgnify:FL=1